MQRKHLLILTNDLIARFNQEDGKTEFTLRVLVQVEFCRNLKLNSRAWVEVLRTRALSHDHEVL